MNGLTTQEKDNCTDDLFAEMLPLSADLIRPSQPIRPGWRWRLLTDVARLATGHTPSRREPSWWGGDIHWLQLPDIRAVDGRRVLKTLEQINELGLANSAAVLLPVGTVCMSRTASVGFVTILGQAMATSQDFVNWVCGPELDPDFLMYVILRCRREIRALGSGATHHSIYFETVENFSVCIPPLAEQRLIATALARQLVESERLAAVIHERLAAAEALPAAYSCEVFEGAESSTWEMMRLGDICEGAGQYGTSERSNSQQRGLPVLGMPHIYEGRIRWRNVFSVALSPEDEEKYRLQRGDLLFNRTNSAELVGKTAVFDGARDAVFASYLIRFRIREGVADPHFVSAFINSRLGRAFIQRHMARASGQVNISASTMAEMPVPCPPIEVQRRIADRLARVSFGEAERLADVIRDELAAIQALPAAFLREAFQQAV